MKSAIASLLPTRVLQSKVYDQYKITDVNGTLYLQPATGFTKGTREIDQEALLLDFLLLLTEIQDLLSPLCDWQRYIETGTLHINVKDIDPYDVALLTSCGNALLPFVSKWGLFGVAFNRIANETYDASRKQPMLTAKAKSTLVDILGDGLPSGEMDAKDYFSYFFPGMEKSRILADESFDFYASYSESVRSILYNHDFLTMLKHHARRDFQDTFIFTPPDIGIKYRKGQYTTQWGYNGLMQLLTVLYANNLMDHKVGICLKCGEYFRPKNQVQKFCSPSCSGAYRAKRFRDSQRKEKRDHAEKERQ